MEGINLEGDNFVMVLERRLAFIFHGAREFFKRLNPVTMTNGVGGNAGRGRYKLTYGVDIRRGAPSKMAQERDLNNSQPVIMGRRKTPRMIYSLGG